MDQSTSQSNTNTGPSYHWQIHPSPVHSIQLSTEGVFKPWDAHFDAQLTERFDYPAHIEVEEPVPISTPLDATEEDLLHAASYEPIPRPWPNPPPTTPHDNPEPHSADAPNVQTQAEPSSSESSRLSVWHSEPAAQAPYHNLGTIPAKPETSKRSKKRRASSSNTAVDGSCSSHRRST